MKCEYLLIASIFSIAHGGYNNLPPVYNPNQKVIDCNDQTVCEIDLVVEALESMTYYDYRNEFGSSFGNARRKIKAYRAFYYKAINNFQINEGGMVPDKSTLQPPIMTDGFFRPIFTINGQMPGPTIVANMRTVLKITVHNELKNNEGIAIHWHGMHQRNTPEMDGVPYISQTPLLPNQNMIYEFSAYPGGTHWYHAHGGTQRTDGIYGALIVKDTIELDGRNILDLYDQHTLILMDWSWDPSHKIAQELISTLSIWKDDLSPYPGTKGPDGTTVGPFPFRSGLINDKGRFCDYYLNGLPHCNLHYSQLNYFSVKPNNIYRFRLIGAQSAYAFKFSIQEHYLTVVATDGNPIQPIKNVQYVIVNTGERYDVLVDTSGHEIKNYWILAETIEKASGSENEDFYSPISLHKAEAVLQYNSSSTQYNTKYIQEPSQTWDCSYSRMCKVVNCPIQSNSIITSLLNYECHNVPDFVSTEPIPDAIHMPVDTLFYNFDFHGETTTNASSVDGINFRFPSYSPLSEYNKFKCNENDYICPERGCPYRLRNSDIPCFCTHQIKLNNIMKGDSVEIVISNINSNPERLNRGSSHPVHLHGHSFYVVKTAYPTYNSVGISGNNQDLLCSDDNGNECAQFNTVKSSQFNIMQDGDIRV